MKARNYLVVSMIVLVMMTRLLPHWPNFTPIDAVALFAAVHLRPRWTAMLVPLIAMLLSDLALSAVIDAGVASGWIAMGQGLHRGMWVVYGTIAIITAMSMFVPRNKSVGVISALVLSNSMIFFVLTNLAVWARGVMYPVTWDGLVMCFYAAVPFYQYTLLGDLFYATVLFGAYALAVKKYPALEATPA